MNLTTVDNCEYLLDLGELVRLSTIYPKQLHKLYIGLISLLKFASKHVNHFQVLRLWSVNR